MTDISKMSYSILDKAEVSIFLFHPRYSLRMSDRDMAIPVGNDIVVGAKFHMTKKSAPNILFFHGNGEIVADYDDIGQMYEQLGINFLPVDYRGYGHSTGKPKASLIMQDCHVIFKYVKKWLKENAYTGRMILMGRSLGSASVLEIAAHHKKQFDALIIESGFAHTGPLLRLLGTDIHSLNLSEDKGFRNLDKIREVATPTLIIHAEHDHIIPFSDGQALYDICPAEDKTLLKIPEANHNDIFLRGSSDYMTAIKALTERIA
ncbi:MAG: alpha/beta hydrolase [Desulfobacteraceae bacterium 4572_88]|nr:MAG: alpha/beta hydrolase [Desulfobacteraceae bacterium 4572_88]RLC09679.1 MAG: alpha/beta hydrolase [Deltaproteobacteria bacterium]